jgi:molecular chaperone GrpE
LIAGGVETFTERRMPEIFDDAAPTLDERSVDALQADNAALRDRLLRALAEAENERRRAERTAAEARQYAVADFARELLEVLDNLQRAIAAAEQAAAASSADQALIDGVRATERMLVALLERFGVRRIEALGRRFDPNLHEALFEVDDDAHPPGTVVQVVEDGYTIHHRLLRPARVVVAKGSVAGPSSAPLQGDPSHEHS